MPGTGADDADGQGLQGQGQVVGQPGDLADLDPQGRLVFEAAHHRPGHDGGHPALHPEMAQGVLQLLGLGQHGVFLHLVVPGRRRVQEVQARQGIGPGDGRGFPGFGAGSLSRRGC